MEVAFSAEVIIVPILTIVFFVSIAVQVILSGKPNKWYGLIIPFCTFIISIVISLFNIDYIYKTFVVEAQDGSFVQTITNQGIDWVSLFQTFAFLNIITVVNLIIYFIRRIKYKNNTHIDKMKIQDL